MNVHYMLRSDGTGNFTEESDLGSADFAAHGQTWVGNFVAADTTDNGSTSSYTVVEVDQADKPIGPVSTVSIMGEPVRYKLHFAPKTRYRVVLTVSNGCNSSSTKYINTRYRIRKPAAAPTGALTLFPNPAARAE